VRDLLKVEWLENDPARGVDYVYLSDEDYEKVQASVKATLRPQPDGEVAIVACNMLRMAC
jgi:hypothetical protein